MGAVHVCIGHDDDFMVPQLLDVEILSDVAAEGCDHIFDLLGIQDLIQSCLFHIEDLAPKRKDRLSLSVAAAFGGTTGRISLYQKDFG